MYFKEEFRKFAVKDQNISGLAVDQYLASPMGMTRAVIEERERPFREIDVFSRLMADRIIFLGMNIDDIVSNVVIAQLLFLESLDSKKDLLMYINSPGGSVYAGLGIYDTMNYVRPDVVTICTGMAASMASVLLAAGEKGKRSALPHSRVMIHQPWGGVQGQASDIDISVKEYKKIKNEMYEILSKHSNQSIETIEKDSDRDYWMRADEAKKYGLIDEVLSRD